MKAIPDAALAQHTAILGKTGRGKTSTGKLAVEQVFAEGARVCILDPIKSDWWGLTSSADGRKPGLPFTILGGPHGHVSLHASAGRAIGELVATGELPHSIIDMADFEAGGLQRFFIDFAQTLFKRMRGVVYLVIEEAHEFAPKELAGIGQEAMAIHWAKKLATGSRTKGIRLVLLTHRVQSLHNALLGSCDTMIAHGLIAPADQAPVVKWLKANIKDTALRTEVEDSLSSLPTGTGWICSGEAKIFEKVAFPRIATYDNTKTPTHDGAERQVITAPVDEARLRAIIGDAVAVAEANDPKRLKARIAELETQVGAFAKNLDDVVAARAAAEARVADPEAIGRAELAGYRRGYNECVGAAGSMRRNLIDKLGTAQSRMESALDILAHAGDPELLPLAEPDLPDPLRLLPGIRGRLAELAPAASPSPGAARPLPSHPVHGDLSKALQKALDAIAWWRKIGVEPVERARAAVVAGYSPRASTFHGYLATLASRGLVEVLPGAVKLTPEGLQLANTPTATTRADLRNMGCALFTGRQLQVFDAVYVAYPDGITRAEIAGKLGMSARASTVHCYIAEVAAYGVIETTVPGTVRLADWFFP
jgi:hypothetical protein